MADDRMRRLTRRFQRAAAASAGLALALALRAAPASADPLSEPERGMDPPISLRSLKRPDFVAMVGGDSNHLFTWLTNENDSVEPTKINEIRGARVYPTGKLLETDANGFSLGLFPFNFNGIPTAQIPAPKVAYGGGSYLVTWNQEGTIRASLVPAYGDLTGALMPESTVLDASITDAAEHLIAFDSATMQFLVTWFEGLPSTSIRGMRVSAGGGALTTGAPFTIADLSAVNAPIFGASLACADDGCLLTFDAYQGMEIYGARIQGDSPAPSLFLIGTNPPAQPQVFVPAYPQVAFDGTNYLVVWTRNSMAGEFSLVAARVDKSGAVLDPGGSVIVTSAAIAPRVAPRAGSPPLLVWIEPVLQFMSLRASRVDTSGLPAALDPGGVLVHQIDQGFFSGFGPSVAGGGPLGLIAHMDRSFSSPLSNIFVSVPKVSGGALTVTPVAEPISRSWNHQTDPVVVWMDQAARYLAIWKDSRDESSEPVTRKLMGAILSEDGKAESFHDLSPFYGVAPHATVTAAAGTANILVAWLEASSPEGPPGPGYGSRLRAALVSHEGEPSSPTPIDVLETSIAPSEHTHNLSVLYDGSAYVLITPSYDRILAARVGVSGAVLEVTPIQIHETNSGVPGEGFFSAVQSAYGGNGEFMTVWIEENDVYCRPFNTASNTIKASSAGRTKIGEVSPFPLYTSVAVAYGSGSYLAVWADSTKGGSIFGTRLGPSGERLDTGFQIAHADDQVSNLRVVFDGTSYLVLWRDNLTTYGAWVSRDGSPVAQDRLTVAGGPGFLGRPTVASSGRGRSLIAYSRSHFTETGPSGMTFDAPRARTRIINNDCTVPSPIECKAETPCFGGGECNPATKTCTTEIPLPDGALCEGGLCFGGLCFEDPATPEGPAAGAGGMNNAPVTRIGGCGCEAAGEAPGASLGSLVAALLAALGRRVAAAPPSLRALRRRRRECACGASASRPG